LARPSGLNNRQPWSLSCRYRLVDEFGELGYGRRIEHIGDRQRDVPVTLDLKQHRQGRKRIPAAVEEVVVDADRLYPKSFAAETQQHQLGRRARQRHRD